MKYFIAINLGLLLTAVSALAGEPALNSLSSRGSRSVNEVKLFSKDQQVAAIAELKKKYPPEKMKTIGFCGYKKEPIVLLRVPSFLKWDSECNLHHFKKEIEFCGPSESSPRLSGVFEFAGHKRILQVGLEVIHSKKPLVAKYDSTIFNSTWGAAGALRGVKEIQLGGYPAFEANIEDHSGDLQKSTKSQTLIKFAGKWTGGMLYFIETEEFPKGEIYIWHDEWIFQEVVDGIIKSFEYKVKVN